MNLNLNPWQDLIVCGRNASSVVTDVASKHSCGFADLIKLVSVVINDLTFLATLLVVVVAVFIGISLMTSGGSADALKKAKGRALTLLWGFVWILGAWLVVHTITSTLLNNGYSFI